MGHEIFFLSFDEQLIIGWKKIGTMHSSDTVVVPVVLFGLTRTLVLDKDILWCLDVAKKKEDEVRKLMPRMSPLTYTNDSSRL